MGSPALASPAEPLSRQEAWEWSAAWVQGGDLPDRLPGGWGRFPQSWEAGNYFLSPHLSFMHTLPPRVTNSNALRGRQAMYLGKPTWVYETTGTGGACGKLKSRCPPHRGQTWPMVVMQKWRNGGPVLLYFLTSQNPVWI